jgi:hypothetical protein
MTDSEIINYLSHEGTVPVYKFEGSFQELEGILHSNGTGFNTLKVRDVIYFVINGNPIDDLDERIQVFYNGNI